MVSIEVVTTNLATWVSLKVAQTDHYLSGFRKFHVTEGLPKCGKTIKQGASTLVKGLVEKQNNRPDQVQDPRKLKTQSCVSLALGKQCHRRIFKVAEQMSRRKSTVRKKKIKKKKKKTLKRSNVVNLIPQRNTGENVKKKPTSSRSKAYSTGSTEQSNSIVGDVSCRGCRMYRPE